jgi:hypothetical protein
MNAALRASVVARAENRCEYCHIPWPLWPLGFEVDHILARQHGGQTVAENLAFACQHCNLHKGPNIAGVDPETGQIARLYHPRRDAWEDHFRWAGHELVGLTEIGRATIRVLAMNDQLAREIRAVLMLEGPYPPLSGDT